MPRLTTENREARRAEIVAAARRCFSRDGFHQTSMPVIAAEAGVSTGAPYRYFTGKEQIILEIARQAFRSIFDPMLDVSVGHGPTSIADLVDIATRPMLEQTVNDAAGEALPATELFRCGVQAWGEILRDSEHQQHALLSFNEVRTSLTATLRRGQETGHVSKDIDPEHAARVVIALIHGTILQWVAFDLDDLDGFIDQVRVLLGATPKSATS